MTEKNQNHNSKIKWSIEEQKYMAQAYQIQGIKSWKIISKFINQNFVGLTRTPKQCRERYNNYVKVRSFEKSSTEWSQEENDILFQKYAQMGSKWIQICKFLSGRSQNNIKNRFYCTLRKLIRKINAVQKQQKMKNEKLIKECLIIRLLQNKHKTLLNTQLDQQYLQMLDLSENIKNNILYLLKFQKSLCQKNLIIQLISQIQQLKAFKKCQRAKNKICHEKIYSEQLRISNPVSKDFQPLANSQSITYSICLKQVKSQLGSENTNLEAWLCQPQQKQIQLRMIQMDECQGLKRKDHQNKSYFNFWQQEQKFYFQDY